MSDAYLLAETSVTELNGSPEVLESRERQVGGKTCEVEPNELDRPRAEVSQG